MRKDQPQRGTEAWQQRVRARAQRTFAKAGYETKVRPEGLEGSGIGMGDFGLVHDSFYSRGSGKALRGNQAAQLVGLYLLTCSSANEIGLFYLPLPTLCHELGMALEIAREALRFCGKVGFAQYDEDAELAWVPNAAERRFGTALPVGDRRRKWLASMVRSLGNHRFVRQFVTRYGVAYGLTPQDSNKPLIESDKPLIESEKGPLTTSPSLSLVSSDPDPDLPPPVGSPRDAYVAEAQSGTHPVTAESTPPPADIPITEAIRGACGMAGAPVPTRDHVQAMLADRRSKGRNSYDWPGEVVAWMLRQKSFDARAASRGGGAKGFSDARPTAMGLQEGKAVTMSPRPTRAQLEAIHENWDESPPKAGGQ